ncbi:MAG: phosphatidate cytidylyltransferase [Chloroflexota bacterium]|jgi:phosphatidate cytidylyltransferase
MLAQRVVSIVILAPLVLIVVYLGGFWYLVLVAAGMLVGIQEFYSLLQRAGHRPLWPFGLLFAFALIIDSGTPLLPTVRLQPGEIAFPALAFTILLSLGYLITRRELKGSLVDWSLTWAPPLYIGVLLTYLISLRFLPEGDKWVYLLLGVTWSTDIAAYVTGRLIGKRRFFPHISPRKTVEGAAGGVLAGVLAGALLAWFFGWDVSRLMVLALIGAIAAEAGDLAESLIKRQLHAKDASQLIPGHGGMLDRLDSLLFVGVIVYYWAIWFGGKV